MCTIAPSLVGDWHVAYILLYGPQRLEKLSEEPSVEDMATEPSSTEPVAKDSSQPN